VLPHPFIPRAGFKRNQTSSYADPSKGTRLLLMQTVLVLVYSVTAAKSVKPMIFESYICLQAYTVLYIEVEYTLEYCILRNHKVLLNKKNMDLCHPLPFKLLS
jgi:hypothetical protein